MCQIVMIYQENLNENDFYNKKYRRNFESNKLMMVVR